MQQGLFVRIFVASPGDVQDEREEACQVIYDWNAAHSLERSVLLEPIRLETHAHAVQGGHPQDLLNGQLLERCDILLAVFWSRLGTPTLKDLSGTVQEIREFAEAKGSDRVLLFFCKRPYDADVDTAQLDAVRAFKKTMQSEGLYKEYKDQTEFARLFRQQLELAVNLVLRTEEAQSYLPRGRAEVRLEAEANTLLAAAASNGEGVISFSRSRAGHQISTGRVCYSRGNDPRSEARWGEGLKQLRSAGYIEDRGQKGQVFRLTQPGFRQSDRLWYVLLLREVSRLETAGAAYAEVRAMDAPLLVGHKIPAQFISEKLGELEQQKAVECVRASGEVVACRLADAGRKLLRENAGIELAVPDGNGEEE